MFIVDERRSWNEGPRIPWVRDLIRQGGGAGDGNSHGRCGLWHTGSGLSFWLQLEMDRVVLSFHDSIIT